MVNNRYIITITVQFGIVFSTPHGDDNNCCLKHCVIIIIVIVLSMVIIVIVTVIIKITDVFVNIIWRDDTNMRQFGSIQD